MIEEMFLAAREATNRSANARFKKVQGVDEADKEAARAAEALYHEQPLLLVPELRAFALDVLKAARGTRLEGTQRFPAMLWLGGASDTEGGREFLGDLAGFVRLLKERATKVAGKRSGWVVEPITNIDGHRTNASTKAMHAVFLDCDARGTWDDLLEMLGQLDYAYVAYQSGGWTQATPKWRIVFLLAVPFDTADDAKQLAWKNLYNHLRVVVGAVAGLKGEGFDPATETPACPWFLTERRSEQDPPRQVLWRVGHSLDAMALALALPPVEDERPEKYVRQNVNAVGLSDERLEEIIAALSKATASVPSHRHDLYLALPGVMLDRGVLPDEVLAIVTAVSANYPRPQLDLHKDNVHNARTTISKWEATGVVTRIGTLNARWPAIAKALDDVLPSPTQAGLLAATTAVLAEEEVAKVENTPGARKRRKRSVFAKEVASIVGKLAPNVAVWVKRMINGESFQVGKATAADVDLLVAVVVETLGRNLPLATTWREILDFAGETLLSMDFTQSVERVAAAEKAFLRGQQKRRKWSVKQEAKAANDRLIRSSFFDEVKKGVK